MVYKKNICLGHVVFDPGYRFIQYFIEKFHDETVNQE